MSRKFIFLMNPIAGTGNKSSVRKTIERKMAERKADYEIHATNVQGDYHYLRARIAAGVGDIIVAGGDGTLNAVVNDLRDTGVNFGLIPLGSGNGLALTAGISKNTATAIDQLFTGKAMPVDAFMINDRFSCMLSGLGFDAQVAHDFAKQNTRGLMTYVKQTYNNFLKARPYRFEIIEKDNVLNTEAFFISIANSNQFGNQFTIAPCASLTDGKLDIVVVQKMSKLQMLMAVLRQVVGGEVKDRPYKKDQVIYFQTSALTIRNEEHAPLHIDGDPVATASVFDIRVIPGAFRLIRPAERE